MFWKYQLNPVVLTINMFEFANSVDVVEVAQ